MFVKTINNGKEEFHLCDHIAVTRYPTVMEPNREGFEVELCSADKTRLIRLPEDAQELYVTNGMRTELSYRWPPKTAQFSKQKPASASRGK